MMHHGITEVAKPVKANCGNLILDDSLAYLSAEKSKAGNCCIGSKTFRERALSAGTTDSFLEIGVPYLAGTYDERMYEELRLRARTFEVLTGGDLAADEAEGHDDHQQSEGQETGLRFVPLPDSLLDAMRVHLHVWSDNGLCGLQIASTT